MSIYFTAEDDLLNPCWDNVFKAMFTTGSNQSRKALKGLLSAILDRQVIDVSVMQNEPAVESKGERRIRFDINCKFNDGEPANIEMTISPDKSEKLRIEYYGAKLHICQDIKGTDKTYADLKHSYQISIVSESLLKGKNFLHYFEYIDQYGEKLDGRTHIIIVELSKLSDIARKPIEKLTSAERWAVFFRFCADKSKRELVNKILEREETIEMAGELLLHISKDENTRARLLSEYKYEVDLQSKMVGAKREGLKEGEKKAKLKMAKSMLKKDLPITDIAEITGLSVEKIKSLKL